MWNQQYLWTNMKCGGWYKRILQCTMCTYLTQKQLEFNCLICPCTHAKGIKDTFQQAHWCWTQLATASTFNSTLVLLAFRPVAISWRVLNTIYPGIIPIIRVNLRINMSAIGKIGVCDFCSLEMPIFGSPVRGLWRMDRVPRLAGSWC